MADENKDAIPAIAMNKESLEHAKMTIEIIRMLKPETKAVLAEAIKNRTDAGTLEYSYATMYETMRYTLWRLMEDYPEKYQEYLREYAEILSVSINDISNNLANAEDDESQDLPGLLEPEENRRIKAPPYIFHDKTIMPLSYLARTIDRLKFDDLKPEEIEEIGIKDAKAIAQIPIDKSPHTRYIYMLMLDRLAAEYPITPLDKNILIAIGNLYGERKEAGYTGLQDGSVITAEHIIRRYRGLDAYTTIEPSLIEEVEQRMKVLMDMMVSFDFTQHFDYRKLNGDEVELDIPDDLREMKKEGTIIRFSYRGNMVHANQIEVEYSNGKIGKAFEILTPPIVYDYARKIKQVATIETKLLDLRKKANGSKNADIMKVYLLERILAMIDPKTHQPKPNFSHSIKLDRMFEDLRMDVKNRVSKKNKVDTMKKILDHFKETEDSHRGTFINGYTEQKGYRGAVIGFEIHF